MRGGRGICFDQHAFYFVIVQVSIKSVTFCHSIVIQIIVSLSFVLQIWECHMFRKDCQFVLQIDQSIQSSCH